MATSVSQDYTIYFWWMFDYQVDLSQSSKRLKVHTVQDVDNPKFV